VDEKKEEAEVSAGWGSAQIWSNGRTDQEWILRYWVWACVLQMHCSIEYCTERQRYMVKDHASQAGTFVNGKRLSKVRHFRLSTW